MPLCNAHVNMHQCSPIGSQRLQLGRRVWNTLLGRHALEGAGDGLHDDRCGATPPARGEDADGVCEVAAGVAVKVAAGLQPEGQPARQDTHISAERALHKPYSSLQPTRRTRWGPRSPGEP